MYHNDGIREGYYCDLCDEGCCNNYWIVCSTCMQQLRMDLFTARDEILKLRKEIGRLELHMTDMIYLGEDKTRDLFFKEYQASFPNAKFISGWDDVHEKKTER